MSPRVDEMTWAEWRRPPAPPRSSLEFMAHSISASDRRSSDVHVFGTTAAGEAVHCLVQGFHHYFWLEKPPSVHAGCLEELRAKWNSALASRKRYNDKVDSIVALELVRRESLLYYKGPDAATDFLKVTLATPMCLYDARTFLRAGNVPLTRGQTAATMVLYEEDGLDYATRFMCDTNTVGFGWVSVTQARPCRPALSPCTHDVVVALANYRAYTPDDDMAKYSRVAPLRTFDFDIECCSTKGFPQAARDPVIQIAVQVWETGSAGKRLVLDTILYTRTTDAIGDGVVMAEYTNESKMLLGFKQLVLATDYDVSRNFNGRRFDWSYLVERAEALHIDDAFCAMSRLYAQPATLEDGSFQSKARGTREFRDVTIAGRTDFDICHVTKCEKALKSYTLNSVSMAILKQTKEDVHHSMIPVLYNGSPADRLRLARYCRKDALLCRLIDEKEMFFVRYIEQARVCGVTLDVLVRQGQQAKVQSQLMRLALEFGFVLPLKRNDTGYAPAGQYEGGLVLDPDVGFHTNPICCMDFSSLYPSEDISENLDYTTLLKPADALAMNPDDVFKGPAGHSFVRAHVRKGLMCILLSRLLAARTRAKGDVKAAMKAAAALREAGDEAGAAAKEYEAAVQDARQLALKLSANSGYGFTGVQIEAGGKMPCMEVAETITACGRRDLRAVIAWLKAHYSTAIIRYGDTDSVMVEPPGCATVSEAMNWMHRVAAEINADLFDHRAPMKLAPEKVMCPTEYQSAKKYICAYFEKNPLVPDKVYYRGVETRRRDTCELVGECLEACCELIFIKNDIDGAVQQAKNTIESLYLNKVDMSQLIVTKSLSHPVEEYTTPQPHSLVAAKMARRDPTSAPSVGDRIAYVMVGDGGTKGGVSVRDLAEDPLYALEHELPVNIDYYITNQLAEPLKRLFIPIIGERRTQEIFNGPHTRKRVRPSTTAQPPARGSIMSFALVKRACAECRTLYDPKVHTHPSLCAACVGEFGEAVEVRKRARLAEVQEKYTKQFAKCQTCQGSDRDPVLCFARDCPELYKRKGLEIACAKAAKDIEDIATTLKK